MPDMINVFTLSGGILDTNTIFTGKDATARAEKFFKEQICKLDPGVSEEDIKDLKDEGYFDNGNGKEVIISWPEVM